MDKLLNDLYLTAGEPSSFASVTKLAKASGVKRKDVENWLSGQEPYTMFRQARKRFKRRRILTSSILDLVQADLAHMPFEGQNDGIRYLVFIIDTFSKFLWIEPVKNKKADTVNSALKKWLRNAPGQVQNFQTDKGTEFINADVKKLMEKHNVNFYTGEDPETKAACAERSIRTIKGKIYRYMKANNTHRYIDVLQDIVNSYNNSVHRSIGMKPVDVTKANSAQVLSKLFPKRTLQFPPKFKFDVGQKVRISSERTPFTKGYYENFSQEIYEVTQQRPTDPVTYYIKDYFGEPIKGQFYEKELIAVKEPEYYKIEKVLETRNTRKGGKEFLVQWMGLPKDQAQWIPEKDMIAVGEPVYDEGPGTSRLRAPRHKKKKQR